MSELHIRTYIDAIERTSQIVEKRRNDVIDMARLINCSREFKEDCIRTGSFYIEIDGPYDDESLFDAVESVIQDDDHLEKGIIL